MVKREVNKKTEKKARKAIKKEVVANVEKKTEKKVENKQSKKQTAKQKQNKQILWILFLMISMILIILLTPYVMKNFINKFDYIGLDFYKTKTEGIIFYYTEIPLINTQGFPIGEYSVYFRNDPRELEYINVEIIENKIEFEKELPVYISIQYDAPICDENLVSVVGLTNFLDKFGTLTVKGALHNVFYDSTITTPIVTCESNPDNTVLLMKTGEETKLTRVNKNCYEIQYNECEIGGATEKFILTIMEAYMEKYEEIMEG